MGRAPLVTADIDMEEFRVNTLRGRRVASLRHFDRGGALAAAVHEWLGTPLPATLQNVNCRPVAQDAHAILAWRSPTETLLICDQDRAFAALEQRLAAITDGCMVDQTGGISILHLHGRRAVDVLQRLGARTAIPDFGEARAARIAEVHALTLSVRAGEFLICVERPYAAHLVEWMRVTASDL